MKDKIIEILKKYEVECTSTEIVNELASLYSTDISEDEVSNIFLDNSKDYYGTAYMTFEGFKIALSKLKPVSDYANNVGLSVNKPEIIGWNLSTNENGIEMATLPADILRNAVLYIEQVEPREVSVGEIERKLQQYDQCVFTFTDGEDDEGNPYTTDDLDDAREYYAKAIHQLIYGTKPDK